jgi:predicted RND superfamily exporter protein
MGLGFSMHTPMVQTDFSSFTKATTNASLTRDAFLAALNEREGKSRAMRRLSEEHQRELEELGLEIHGDDDEDADYDEEMQDRLESIVKTHMGGSGFKDSNISRAMRRLQEDATVGNVDEGRGPKTTFTVVKEGDPSYDPVKGHPLYKSFDFLMAWEPSKGSKFEKPGEMFSDEAFKYMQKFEEYMRNQPEWKAMCADAIASAKGLCEPGVSITNYAMPTMITDPDTGLPMTIRFDGRGASTLPLQVIFTLMNQAGVGMILTPKTFRESQPEKTSVLRLAYRFKFLCCWTGMTRDEKMAEREKLDDRWLTFASDFILPFMEKRDLEAEESGKPHELRLFFVGSGLAMLQVMKALMLDARFAIGSFFVVFLYLTIHTQSIFLAILGLLMMVLSIPLSFSGYVLLADSGQLSIASFLSLFVIVGIGADDVFVYTDFWRFSKDECNTEEERIKFTFHHAGKATIATSVTTALAFFANLASVLGPLREFGVFMGLCVVWLWILVTLLYTPLLIIESRIVDTKYCGWCRLNFDLISCMQKCKAKSSGKEHQSQNRLLWWSNFLAKRRRMALMASAGSLVLFLVGTASFLDIDMSVPNIFPDSHNLGRGVAVMEMFLPPMQTFNQYLNAPKQEQSVCGVAAFRGDDHLCSMFWCGLGPKVPKGQCKCWRAQKDKECPGRASVRVQTRVVSTLRTAKSTYDDVNKLQFKEMDNLAGWLVSQKSEKLKFRARERVEDMYQRRYPNLLVDDKGTGTISMQKITDVETSLIRDDPDASSCGWVDICYCGDSYCAEPLVKHKKYKDWYEVTDPPLRLFERSRRLSDSNESTMFANMSDTDLWFQDEEPERDLTRPAFPDRYYDMDHAPLLRSGFDGTAFEDVPEHGDGADRQLQTVFAFGAASWNQQMQFVIPKNKRSTIDVVFGIAVGANAPLLGVLPETWQFSEAHKPYHPASQRSMFEFCANVPRVMRVTLNACWILTFANYMAFTGVRFPLADREDFDRFVKLFSARQRTGVKLSKNYMWLRRGVMKASFVSFLVDIDRNGDAGYALEYQRLWDRYVLEYNRVAPPFVRGCFHTAQLWVRSEATQELIGGTMTTLLIIVIFSFVSMFVFTKDLRLAVFVVCSTLWVVIGLLFFIVVVMQLSIGAIEVIALIAFIGYALDYSFHIAHEYSLPVAILPTKPKDEEAGGDKSGDQPRPSSPVSGLDDENDQTASLTKDELTPFQQRKRRVTYSTVAIGGAALGSALTTGGSAFFLLFCQLTLFPRLGAVVIAVTFISIVASFCPLPAMLLVRGPINPGQGFVIIGKKLWKCVRPFVLFCLRMAKIWSSEDDAAKNDPAPVDPPPGGKPIGFACVVVLVGLLGASIGILSGMGVAMDTHFDLVMRTDTPLTNLHEIYWSLQSQRIDGGQSDKVISGMRKHGAQLFYTFQLEIGYQPTNSTFHKSSTRDYKEFEATFGLESMTIAREIETRIRNVEDYKKWYKKVPGKWRKDCRPGISMVNYLLPSPSSLDKYIQTSRSHVPDYFLFDGKGGEALWPDGYNALWGEFPLGGIVPYLEKHNLARILLPKGVHPHDPRLLQNNTKAFRTTFIFRIPCCSVGTSPEKQEEWLKETKTEWMDWLDLQVLPLLRKPYGALHRSYEPIKVWYNGTFVDEIHAREIMRTEADFYYAAMAVMVVFLLNHNGSIFLSLAAAALTIACISLAYVVTSGVGSWSDVGVNMAVFPAGCVLIAWLGVDACCILTDIAREPDTQGKTRTAYTMKRGGATILPTMLMVAGCSLTCLISSVSALRELGLFVCFGAVFVAVFSLLVFVPVCDLDEEMCKKCCKGRLRFKGYCPGTHRLGLYTKFINYYRISAITWVVLGTLVFLILGMNNLHDIDPFNRLTSITQNIFRMEDNFHEGRRLFAQFEPISESVWDENKAFTDLPKVRDDQVKSAGSGQMKTQISLNKKGYLPYCDFFKNTWDNEGCPFYWCDVLPPEFAENNISRCDCYRKESYPADNETCTDWTHKKHVQRFFGWMNHYWLDEWQHKSVRTSSIDPAVPRTIIGKDTYDASIDYDLPGIGNPVFVEFPYQTGQSNLTVKEIPPLIIQEWTSGQFGVEPALEVETWVPRLSVNDTCETHDACFCGDRRCASPDFTKYESYNCGDGMVLMEENFWGGHDQCQEHCREIQCTAFIAINGGNAKAGTCQFFSGKMYYNRLSLYRKDQRDCFIMRGTKLKEVDNYVEYGGYVYASMDNVQPHAWFAQDRGWSLYKFGEVCQTHWNKLPVPDGWEIVPDVVDKYGINITDFIRSQSFSTYGMVLGNGRCYETHLATDDICWTSKDLLQTDGAGLYWSAECFNRVLIRRPHKTVYVGCYRDDRSRDFKEGPRRYGWQTHSKYGEYFSNHTTSTCRQFCKDYDYFALQQSGYCMCSNDYYRYWKYSIRPDSECGNICQGEEGLSPPRYCGGYLTNAVYKVKEEDDAPGATWTQRCTSCATHAPEDRQGTYLNIIKRPYEEIAMCRSQCATIETREEKLYGSGNLYGCLNDCDMRVKSKELFTDISLEQCKEYCRMDPSCKSIELGKNTRQGVCYLNRVEMAGSYTESQSYDTYVIHRTFWPKTAIDVLHTNARYTLGPETDIAQSLVHVVFGIDVFTESPMFGRTIEGPWSFSDKFSLADPSTQVQISYFCQMVSYPHWASTMYQHCPGTYLRVTQKWCWMDDFRKWLIGKGHTFPVQDRESFNDLAEEFSFNTLIRSDQVNKVDFHGYRTKSTERADKFVWVRGGVIKAMHVTFALDVNATDRVNTKLYYYAQPKGVMELKEIWDKYLSCWNDKQGAASKGAWHTSSLWADMEQKHKLMETTIAAIGISLAIVVFISLLTTCHKRLFLVVGGCVILVESGVAFLLFPVLGRAFGPVEACALVAVAWVAAVPALHVAHLYKQEQKPPGNPEEDPAVQYLRTRSCILGAGRATVGTAMTMTCTAACLYGSELHALQEMAAVISLAAFLAGLGAMVALPSLLLLCTGKEDFVSQQVPVAPLISAQSGDAGAAADPLPPPSQSSQAQSSSQSASDSPLPSAPNVNTIGKGSGLNL